MLFKNCSWFVTQSCNHVVTYIVIGTCVNHHCSLTTFVEDEIEELGFRDFADSLSYFVLNWSQQLSSVLKKLTIRAEYPPLEILRIFFFLDNFVSLLLRISAVSNT